MTKETIHGGSTPVSPELIDEAGAESFPASDPPVWTATHAGTPVPPKQGDGRIEQRPDPWAVAPAAYKAMVPLQGYVNRCGLAASLLDLVKIRASQINGCAFCIAMHVREARARGESDERMHLLNAWREAPVYSSRERAALAWTECVTLVSQGHVPDAIYREARQQFSEQELVDLTTAVVAINAWNRFAIAFRRPPETSPS
jgi:AhpD family alkylhydroperoxidase